MKQLRHLAFLFAGIMALAMTGTVQAAVNPNVLVLAEDYDDDTVPRTNRVNKLIVSTLKEMLAMEGVSVKDETFVSMYDFEQHRNRRDREELFDIVRSLDDPPIDAVLLYTVYIAIDTQSSRKATRIRIEGELINAKDGSFLGRINETSSKRYRLPRNCEAKECVLEMVGEEAEDIAANAGGYISETIVPMIKRGFSTTYRLKFEGFKRNEVMKMQEYLARFTGYKSARITSSGSRIVEIRYEGSTDATRMDNNLNRILDELDYRGVVSFESSDDNAIRIRKVGLFDFGSDDDDDDGW